MKGNVLKVLLVLVLVVAMLAGCGAQDASQDEAQNQTDPPTVADKAEEVTAEDPTDPPFVMPTDPPAPPHGDVLQLKMDVAVNATGSHAYYNEVFTIPADVVLEPGDMFVYDVYLYNELGGVGTIDLYAGKNLSVTLRDDVLSMDQHAVRNHPTTNIAGLALNQWYNRRVNITDAFITEANLDADQRGVAMIACEIPEMKYFAGETITVTYDNICIMRGEEVIYTLFEGRDNALPETFTYLYDLSGNENVITTLQIIDESGNPVQ